MLTVGSLFAGIGGFDLGFARAGFKIKWQVEIDPFCRAVLEKHWPHVRRYEYVKDCFGSPLRVGCAEECGRAHFLCWVDWIVGGFPCQDLSCAGKRAGVDGGRSGLWREFIRIVAEVKPKGVVVENVHHTWRKWVPVVRRALWDLGYASLSIRLRASDFGAWHQRSRVFLVAHADPSVLRLESWRGGWPFWEDPPLFADADALLEQPEGCGSEARRWLGDGSWWATEPDLVRVVHGVSSRLDGRRMALRLGALGNAVIPEEVEWIARQIKAHAEGVAWPFPEGQ